MRTRKNMRGGFSESLKVWPHSICKYIIQQARLNPGPNVLKNYRSCLIFLALQLNISPEDVFNKMTPREYVKKIGHPTIFENRARSAATAPDGNLTNLWHLVETHRNKALEEGHVWGGDPRLKISELPGKEVASTLPGNSVASSSKGRSSSRNKK